MCLISKCRNYISHCLDAKTLTDPSTECKPKDSKKQYDAWVIYSGSKGLNWYHEVLEPFIFNHWRIGLDEYCEIPGTLNSETTVMLRENSEKVIIVLSSETSETENEWFMYQIAMAFCKRNPNEVLVCQTDTCFRLEDSKFKCLIPVETITSSNSTRHAFLNRVCNFL